ncbi:ATP-binding cassette domain-containing protein [Paenibacillus sp. 5J-6]|uniref:ATP-binding cassette domain-containing protein n=1 Tax=Paenibacillus silvestris TaxID=2606219 RepID=A0A6L8V5P2_9BACL|nr:ABC transporter ATP-binding protein [Paenibacillus silvestris]MZQ85607.1 ATP-binding cassette domain-containing protein [Paenibacillus silvestris]
MNIGFEQVTKLFGHSVAVNQINFTIQDGEFFTLLGPSGCGKTTLLRIIAGFYRQDQGNLYFGSRLMNEVPTHQRNIGMVFQNYAIFPHMSVFDNVAYGLKARKVSKPLIEKKVMEALEMVELQHLRDRSPSEMSGGQQQRIALARAVVIEPGLLLMDEPLSNLDAKLRIKMRADIRALQKKLKITTIYVTHDQEEALAVSDRIAVMSAGTVQQIGSPQDIYLYPENRTVAHFIGTSNFVEAVVNKYDAMTGLATILLGTITLKLKLKRNYVGKIWFSIRPERLMIVKERQHPQQLPGVVEQVTFLGGKIQYGIRSEGNQLFEVDHQLSEAGDLLEQEQHVYVDLQLDRAIVFDGLGQEVLYRA